MSETTDNILKSMRECGSAAAMSKALESIDKAYELLSKPCTCIEEVRQACRKARAVLISTPLRNCDIGTAEEQIARFDAECHAIRSRNTVEPCAGCLLSENGEGTEDCQLRWAQMPYEANAEKEGGQG